MSSFSVGQLRTVCTLVSSLRVDRKMLTAIVTTYQPKTLPEDGRNAAVEQGYLHVQAMMTNETLRLSKQWFVKLHKASRVLMRNFSITQHML